MKLDAKSLSKDTLAKLVESMRPMPITDLAMASILRYELQIEAMKIPAKQEAIEKKINAMVITIRSSPKRIKAHNDLVDKYNRLGRRGRSILKKLKKLEVEYPDLLKKETVAGETPPQSGLVQ